MDAKSLIALRKEIEEKRAFFPCIKPYHRIHGLAQALDRDNSEASRAFLKTVYRYIGEMEDLIREECSKRVLDKTYVKPIVHYALESSLDNDYDGDYLLPLLLSYKVGLGDKIERTEFLYLLLSIVNLYKKDLFVWRGKPYAKELFDNIKEGVYKKEFYSSLSSFYKSVLDYRNAKKAALLGASFLFESDRTSSAYLYKDALSCMLYLEEKTPSDEEIRDRYGEDAKLVLSYPSLSSMKLDPVMNTEAFQEVYDEVMEKAMEQYERNGVRIVMALWSFMEEEFAKRGIVWNSPTSLNPFSRFD